MKVGKVEDRFKQRPSALIALYLRHLVIAERYKLTLSLKRLPCQLCPCSPVQRLSKRNSVEEQSQCALALASLRSPVCQKTSHNIPLAAQKTHHLEVCGKQNILEWNPFRSSEQLERLRDLKRDRYVDNM